MTLIKRLEPLLADGESWSVFVGFSLRFLHELRDFAILKVHILGVEISDPAAYVLDLFQKVLLLRLDCHEALSLLIDQVLYDLHYQNHCLVELSVHDVEGFHLEYRILLVSLVILQFLEVLLVGFLTEQEGQVAFFDRRTGTGSNLYVDLTLLALA